jgi:hypothetical protein
MKGCGLFLENLFDIPDLFLDLAGDLFVGAFGFEVRVIGGVANFFLYGSLRVMNRSFDFIFRTVFHFFVTLSPDMQQVPDHLPTASEVPLSLHDCQ